MVALRKRREPIRADGVADDGAVNQDAVGGAENRDGADGFGAGWA